MWGTKVAELLLNRCQRNRRCVIGGIGGVRRLQRLSPDHELRPGFIATPPLTLTACRRDVALTTIRIAAILSLAEEAWGRWM